MTIGQKIRAKRMEKGWSQRDLAAKMHYSDHSTIGKIETGKVDIPQSRIVQFSEVLDVSIAYLMGWEEEQKEKPTDDGELSEGKQALIDFAKSVPEEKAGMILAVMKTILQND
jgi:transcriptional regulator with XRE-family HTH domain